MSPEDFARILALLSPVEEEAGSRYNRLHTKLTGFFRLKGISDPMTAADETLDRALLKIDGGAIVPDVEKYCMGIARNIAKERRRLMHREELASHKFNEDLSVFPAEQVERIDGILRPCFEQLADEDQQLLLAYCQNLRGRARAEHRRQLAEMRKLTVLALRIKVTRLRNRLTDCARKRSNSVEQGALLSNKPKIWSIFL